MFSKFTDDKEGREIVETTPRSEVWGGGGGGSVFIHSCFEMKLQMDVCSLCFLDLFACE
jgi:hypothetical protein